MDNTTCLLLKPNINLPAWHFPINETKQPLYLSGDYTSLNKAKTSLTFAKDDFTFLNRFR